MSAFDYHVNKCMSTIERYRIHVFSCFVRLYFAFFSSFLSPITPLRYMQINAFSPTARGGNLSKIPPNQVIGDFGREVV